MNEEKGGIQLDQILGLLEELPSILRMEQTEGVLTATLETIGVGRLLKITSSALGPTSLTNLLSLRLDLMMGDLLSAMWDAFEDKLAIISGEKRITYAELKDRVFRLSNALSDIGLKSKDRVGIMLYNSSEFMESIFGAGYGGRTAPQINWHLKDDELATVINTANPKALILDEEFLEKIITIKDQIGGVQQFIVVGDKAPSGMVLYEDLLGRSSSQKPQEEFSLALNPYTAGTTGIPKSVNYYDILMGIGRVPLREQLRYLIMEFSFIYYLDFHKTSLISPLLAPIYHAGALVGLAPFALGGTLVAMKRFDAEESLKLIERQRCSLAFVVPTMLQRWVNLPEEIREKYDLSSMEVIICAAAPCPPELKRQTNDLFGKPVFHEYYGSAETQIVSVLRPEDYLADPKRYVSVGKARCGELMILDEKGKECPPGVDGRVCSRTAMTINLEYSGTPFHTIEGKEYFDDELIGHVDEDGFLYLVEREKDMIISGGVNIFPWRIEERILNHPKVADVAVIGIPHPDLGEVAHAEVQLKEGETATPDEIIEHCRKEGLSGYNLPKSLNFVGKLPRHIDGKLLKREIRKKYWGELREEGRL